MSEGFESDELGKNRPRIDNMEKERDIKPMIHPESGSGMRFYGGSGGGEQSRRRERNQPSQPAFIEAKWEVNELKSLETRTDDQESRLNDLQGRMDTLLERADRMRRLKRAKSLVRGANENFRGIVDRRDLSEDDVMNFFNILDQHLVTANERTMQDLRNGDEFAGVEEHILENGFKEMRDKEEVEHIGLDKMLATRQGLFARARRVQGKSRQSQEQKRSTSGENVDRLENALDRLTNELSNTRQNFAEAATAASAGTGAGPNADEYIRRMEQMNESVANFFTNYRGRLPEHMERASWARMEYDIEFYQRFTPHNFPEFYWREPEKQKTLSDRWHLDRLTFIKMATNANPEAFSKNEDVGIFTNEQISRILGLGIKENGEKEQGVEGAKELFERYVDHIIHPEKKLKLSLREQVQNGQFVDVERERSFWEIKTPYVFDKFRQAARQPLIQSFEKEIEDKGRFSDLRESYFASIRQRHFEELRKSGMEEDQALQQATLHANAESIKQTAELLAMEADSTAWGLVYVMNLVEWANSRYTILNDKNCKRAGIEPGRRQLPLIMASDDYTTVYHPQEKFESKCVAGHYDFSPLVIWGDEQLEKIRRAKKMTSSDEIKFIPARGQRQYWSTGGSEVKTKKVRNVDGTYRSVKYKEVKVKAPEAFPTSTIRDGSFLHFNKVLYLDRSDNWQINTNSFRTYSPEEAEEAQENPFGLYNGTRFAKAMQWVEYYRGAAELDIVGRDKKSWRRSIEKWAYPLVGIIKRLKPEIEIENLKNQSDIETYQDFEELKRFAFYASTGGMEHPERRMPTPRFGRLDRQDVSVRLGKSNYLKSTFFSRAQI